MQKMEFVDRRQELAALDRFYRRDSAGLLVLFGRRRVGKTELLSHWLETRGVGDQHAIFWTAKLPVEKPTAQLKESKAEQ